jgi:hypothetical protein
MGAYFNYGPQGSFYGRVKKMRPTFGCPPPPNQCWLVGSIPDTPRRRGAAADPSGRGREPCRGHLPSSNIDLGGRGATLHLALDRRIEVSQVESDVAFLNSAGNGTAIKTCTHYGPQGCPDLEKSRKIHENKESQLRFFDCFRFLKRKCPTG